MAEELHPADALNSVVLPPSAAGHSPDPPVPHQPKRQRRPSVRLGEIGDPPPPPPPPYDSHPRRPTKTWARFPSKTRPLTNLVNGGDSNFPDSSSPHRNPNPSKIRKPTKRARTNWNNFDSTTAINNNNNNSGFAQENENNGEFRELEPEGSESPLLQHSPVNYSVENMGLQFWDQHRKGNRGARLSGILHNEEESVGVREWLSGLGLGKYAPVFEIHEVDDEVLPMLTLEDLKDMGINAVGSRRKMYSSILKLRKGFS